jgi:branched-chain amino acid aminotransferase
MNSEPVVYLRGGFVPASQAHVSIYDFGIVMGATVTDLIRTFQKKPYRLEDHVRRFYESCKYARIRPPVSFAETVGITRELVERNAALLPEGGELAVVYFLTPGENLVYAGSAAAPGTAMQPTFCIHSFPLPFGLFQRFFTDGIHLVTPSIRHVPAQCLDPKMKHRSRLHWWLAEQEARLADPLAMPILLNLEGNLTETSGSNVLLVKNGRVLSPPPNDILLGISRRTIIELCTRLGIEFQERDLQVHDAVNADEIFVATTPYCMAPVTKFNGLALGNGQAGPVFGRLLAAWSADVGVDIRSQIMDCGKAHGGEGGRRS